LNELPRSIQNKIDRYEPVKTEEITTYPVLVKDSRLFDMGRVALEFVQQSLPVALISVPLLTAFYRLDQQTIDEQSEAPLLLTSALVLLRLALRLGVPYDAGEMLKTTRIFADEESGTLHKIVFLTEDDVIEITPRLFQKLRPIIAAQNGAVVPSDTANPQILEMERLAAQKETKNMDPKLCDKVIFAAQSAGVSEEEVWNWPILKLERNAAIAQRRLDYLAVSIGQMSGLVQYKDGNPVPSPYFARKQTGLRSMQSLGAVGDGRAAQTVQNAVNQNPTEKE
jgi:hypothetical protein